MGVGWYDRMYTPIVACTVALYRYSNAHPLKIFTVTHIHT